MAPTTTELFATGKYFATHCTNIGRKENVAIIVELYLLCVHIKRDDGYLYKRANKRESYTYIHIIVQGIECNLLAFIFVDHLGI